MNTKTSRFAAPSLALAAVFALGGCAGMSTRDKNIAGGAGIGGSAIGTVGGAAVGGVIGNEVGKR